MMDEHAFRSGRKNSQEGGPKGIDLDRSMTVLATTSQQQPLLFLDVSAVLATVPSASPVVDVEYELGVLEVAAKRLDKAREAEARAAMAEARAVAAERRARAAGAEAAYEKGRAAKFMGKAERAKAKAARAKARAGFVINGRPWRITAPFSLLYYALKRSN